MNRNVNNFIENFTFLLSEFSIKRKSFTTMTDRKHGSKKKELLYKYGRATDVNSSRSVVPTFIFLVP